MNRRKARRVLAVALVVVVVLAASAGWRWWHNRAPFGPGALSLQSSLEVVGFTESREALGEPVYYAPSLEPKVQLVLGRVSWRRPPEQLDGSLIVVLIDKRANRLPSVIEVRQNRSRIPGYPDPAAVGGSWVQNKIAQRYPWLSGMAYRKTGEDTWLSEGSMVWVDDQEGSPLTFAARFPQGQAGSGTQTAGSGEPVAISDLLLAVVCIGSDDQIYWAHRLQG